MVGHALQVRHRDAHLAKPGGHAPAITNHEPVAAEQLQGLRHASLDQRVARAEMGQPRDQRDPAGCLG